jgi:diacylglycerol O-acyltransferase
MEIMKNVRAAELLSIAASFLGAAPAPLQEMFWRGLPLVPLPLPLLNLICTNIAGSPSALYTVGRRMIASYPQVPTGYELGFGIAVQSYDGKLFFGLTADAHVAPDVGRLRDYIRICFKELCKAAGVRRAPAKRAAPVKPVAKLKTSHSIAAAAPKERAPAPQPDIVAAPAVLASAPEEAVPEPALS